MTDINKILEERGERYGVFATHAEISQTLKAEIRHAVGVVTWNAMGADQKEALEMVCHKIARICNGDPDYADSWRDIAGYATLVADRLDAPKSCAAPFPTLAPAQVAQMEEACAASDCLTLPVRGEVG